MLAHIMIYNIIFMIRMVRKRVARDLINFQNLSMMITNSFKEYSLCSDNLAI